MRQDVAAMAAFVKGMASSPEAFARATAVGFEVDMIAAVVTAVCDHILPSQPDTAAQVRTELRDRWGVSVGRYGQAVRGDPPTHGCAVLDVRIRVALAQHRPTKNPRKLASCFVDVAGHAIVAPGAAVFTPVGFSGFSWEM